MLSECQPPMETHIIIITIFHCLPPRSVWLCLALSLTACCPQLIERQPRCWLITPHEGGERYGPSKSRWHCQSGRQERLRVLEKGDSGGKKRKKLEEVKHEGHKRFLKADLYLAKTSERIREDLEMEHFSVKDRKSSRKQKMSLWMLHFLEWCSVIMMNKGCLLSIMCFSGAGIYSFVYNKSLSPSLRLWPGDWWALSQGGTPSLEPQKMTARGSCDKNLNSKKKQVKNVFFFDSLSGGEEPRGKK